MSNLAREELAALHGQEDKARSTNLFDATLHRALVRTAIERFTATLDALLVRSEVEAPCAVALRASRGLLVATLVDAALRSADDDGECFKTTYRYISCESCSLFDSLLPLTSFVHFSRG